MKKTEISVMFTRAVLRNGVINMLITCVKWKKEAIHS